MKIALVHDALVNRGGAERVFQIFCEMFQDAKIYTTVYLPEKTLPFFKNRIIKTTPLQKVAQNEQQFKLLFPFANYFMQKMIIDDCDIILSSSTFSGKYLSKQGVNHFCYCHTPFRLLWNPDSYLENKKNKWMVSVAQPFLPLLRSWDYYTAQKIYKFISNSNVTQKRISECYNRDSVVIVPPVECDKFKPGKCSASYFLVVSRLEPYKKVDLVINAFNDLGMPLKIVGTGSLLNQFKKLAKQNIDFFASVTDEELLALYQGAIAVIFPQREDYGLVPLEANACSKPVICYGYGGVETTMIPYSDNTKEEATALFFYEQSVDGVKNAILQFMNLNFNKDALVTNAKKFDKETFCKRIKNIINNNNYIR